MYYVLEYAETDSMYPLSKPRLTPYTPWVRRDWLHACIRTPKECAESIISMYAESDWFPLKTSIKGTIRDKSDKTESDAQFDIQTLTA